MASSVHDWYRTGEGLAIEAEIGRGAFGRVYRAQHLRLGVPVAVKVLEQSVVDPSSIRMFKAEARLMARIDHPNVLRVYDYRDGPEGPCIISEWMGGGTVRPPVADEARLREIAVAAASGLQAIHDIGVIHRDIKPSNLLLRDDGHLKLGDLGVSLEGDVTQTGEKIIGTLPYLAPEIFKSGSYTPKSDLYALGVTLFELWSGARPFSGGSVMQLIHKICHERPKDLLAARGGLSQGMANLIGALIHRQPSARPSTGDLLSELLRPERAHTQATENLGPHAEPTGHVIGPWIVTEPIWPGANWVRYIAHHRVSGRQVSLVWLRPESNLPHDVILGSAARASEWEHPNVLPMIDWGMSDGRPYVVLATQGQPIDREVEHSGPLPEHEALELAAQAADAVAYLHGLGYVYQMIEPGSIYRHAGGRGIVLGWPAYCCPIGSDAAGRRVFVAAYAAPEARFETQLCAHTDIYGVGAILLFLATGRTAQSLADAGDKAAAVRQSQPDSTAPTAQLLARLLAFDPEQRPASAADVAARCRQIAARL